MRKQPCCELREIRRLLLFRVAHQINLHTTLLSGHRLAHAVISLSPAPRVRCWPSELHHVGVRFLGRHGNQL